MPNVKQSLVTTYKFKGGELELAIDSPDIEDTDTNSLRISSTMGYIGNKEMVEILELKMARLIVIWNLI
jgi:hypothetical protein